MEWLNRVGIILNFLAGFMLAPELLGITRIQRLENASKERFTQSKAWLQQGATSLLRFNIVDHPTEYIAAVLFSLVFFSPVFFYFRQENYIQAVYQYITSNFFLYLFISILHSLIDITWSRKMRLSGVIQSVINFIKNNLLRLRILVLATNICLLMIIFAIVIPLLILLSRIIGNLLGVLVNKLQSEGSLRSALVWWGIVFFILGNALQFISTFVQDQ